MCIVVCPFVRSLPLFACKLFSYCDRFVANLCLFGPFLWANFDHFVCSLCACY